MYIITIMGDVRDLFLACRKGEISVVQCLVEQRDVDLNIRDKWDSTPLYYACLCGHVELVKYLLDKGARCEAKTFDGERCVYGALNDEIRNLLRSYNAMNATTMRRDLYHEFMRRMLETQGMEDFTFVVHGEMFKAHRCVLSARCQYFAELFLTKWAHRDTIHLNNQLIYPSAFREFLHYIYTSCLEIPLDRVDDVLIIAKQCRMSSLIQQLESRKKKILSFESTKPGVSVKLLCLEPSLESTELQNDLGVLADRALPQELLPVHLAMPFAVVDIPTFPDLIFSVEGHKFSCHKVFFCGRSDYFKALLEDHFGESSQQGDLPVITLHETTATIFVLIMYYIYQDSCELDADNVYDVLFMADMYLLPGLKRQCANTLGMVINAENIVNMLRTSRLFHLSRLEDQCAEFIADNLEKVLPNTDFAQFVSEDARTLQAREETDSIPIIDDIRFHITNFVQTFSDMYEADQKLAAIDNFLLELGLEA